MIQIMKKQLEEKFTLKCIGKKIWNVLFHLLSAALILGLCFVLLYPLLYMLSMAFRPASEALDPSVIWVPKQFTLENIRLAFQYMDYGNSFRNSLTIHVISSLLQVGICSITAYGFARFRFRGSGILFALAIFTILVPSQLIITPLSLQFAYFDFFGLGNLGLLFGDHSWTISLLDSPFSFYLPAMLGSGIQSGLFIFIFRQFFRGLPRELEDAAAIDGCGFFATFMRVILPNALSVCLTAVILSVVWYWNDYFYSSMFVPNYPTVSLSLVNIGSAFAVDNHSYTPYDIATLMQAGALLTTLPVLVMYVVLQRFFVQGVVHSGIVG